MSMGKKGNDEPRKKGMALDDNALENVTGGKTYYAIRWCEGCLNHQQHLSIVNTETAALPLLMNDSHAEITVFDFNGDPRTAEDYFKSMETSRTPTGKRVVRHDLFRL